MKCLFKLGHTTHHITHFGPHEDATTVTARPGALKCGLMERDDKTGLHFCYCYYHIGNGLLKQSFNAWSKLEQCLSTGGWQTCASDPSKKSNENLYKLPNFRWRTVILKSA